MQVRKEGAWFRVQGSEGETRRPVENLVINGGSLFTAHKGMKDVEGAAAERASQIANDGREKA